MDEVLAGGFDALHQIKFKLAVIEQKATYDSDLFWKCVVDRKHYRLHPLRPVYNHPNDSWDGQDRSRLAPLKANVQVQMISEWCSFGRATSLADHHQQCSGVGSRHSAKARFRSSCSKALAMRLISADLAPTALALSRQVVVTAATSLIIARACTSVRPKNSEAASSKSSEQVPSSRSIFVVSTRALRSVGTGLRS